MRRKPVSGERVRLALYTQISRVGLSVEVTVVDANDHRKGSRIDCVLVTVELDDRSTIVVTRADLFERTENV